jgi:putative transposase
MNGNIKSGSYYLAIEAGFSSPSIRVIRELDQLLEWKAKITVIRCDNGTEFISNEFTQWACKKYSY